MNSARIVYVQRECITPRAELDALSACYRIILDSQSKRDRFPDKSGPDDAERNLSDSASHDSTT